MQVQVAVPNLLANNKRQLLYTAHIPDPAQPSHAYVSRMPVELQSMTMQSVSPSGA